LVAPDAAVIWRPELVPHSVVLVPAPDGFAGARPFNSNQPAEFATFQGADGRHLVLQDHDGAHRLWLRGLRPGAQMAALIPLDANVLLRLAGLLRLERHLDGCPAGPLPRAWTITARLRRRLGLMLRALDGHLAQASYREIAQTLHGPSAVARYPWKTSSIRGQTIRLVKDAVVTMEGGYRNLLRGRQPRPLAKPQVQL
jgi:hypothetical protein